MNVSWKNEAVRCPVEAHWRCKRAVRDGGKIIAGELKPRIFFW
jgi:hypothetical protein